MRMDAASYRLAFTDEQLAMLCAHYDKRIDELAAENDKLRELSKLAVHSACLGCSHNDKKSWRSCEGCNIYEMATPLGIEVNG